MDFSKKPEHENPRKGANLISQLFLLWTAPLLWKGMNNGLTKKDLIKCLEEDKSNDLADNLERWVLSINWIFPMNSCNFLHVYYSEWKQELKNASKNQRKPRLWRALLHVHWRRFVVLGFGRFLDIHLRWVFVLSNPNSANALLFFNILPLKGRLLHWYSLNCSFSWRNQRFLESWKRMSQLLSTQLTCKRTIHRSWILRTWLISSDLSIMCGMMCLHWRHCLYLSFSYRFYWLTITFWHWISWALGWE